MDLTALTVGLVLPLVIGLFATAIGLDRERGFYATVMLVIALLYDLYAVIGGSSRALLLEMTVGAVFVGLTVLGFKRNLWWVAVALAGHGVYDFAHPHLFENPGVPRWWPEFCAAYDIVAAGYLAALLKLGRVRATAA